MAAAFVALTKPGITRLVTLTAAVGFVVGSVGPLDWAGFVRTLLGVGLAAAGANALNQWWERERDGRMHRTRERPLPSGRLRPGPALLFATTLAATGTAILLFTVNALAALLVGTCVLTYVLVYTPLKTRTPLCTLVGAVPGALPIAAGWAAAGRGLDAEAWSLFGFMFLWQIPHFLALAWLHRDDYARGGYRMLSLVDETGAALGRQVVLYCAALLPVSLLPAMFGAAGTWYFCGALALGAAFLGLGVRVGRQRTAAGARRLFLASVLYLPLILGLLVLDRG